MSRLIRAQGLVKRYGDFTAVDDVSLQVRPGEILGLIGPNGAGKTTTLKMLAGLLEPTAGTAAIGDRDPTDPAARTRVGYLPEESPVYEDMDPLAYLRFFARLYGVDRAEADRRVAAVLDELDLQHRDRALGDMSKGMRRKVAIARSLINDPDALLFDEPASGLDPLATATVLEFVEAKRQEGRAVIFSAHNLFHVERLCDTLLILRDGRAVAQGPVGDVLEAAGGRAYHVLVDRAVPEAAPHARGHVITATSYDDARAAQTRAEKAGARVLDAWTEGTTLEELFIKLTRDAP